MTAPRLRRLLALAAMAAAGVLALNVPPAAAAQSGVEQPALDEYFTPEQIARSEAYWGPRMALRLGSIALGLVVLGLLTFGPTGRAFAGFARSVSGGRWWLEAPVLAVGVTVIATAAAMPLAIVRFFHDRSYGLVTQSLSGRLSDIGKAVGVEVVLAAVVATGFFLIVRRMPSAWPFAGAAGAAALTVALVFVFPLIYEPLFNTFTPASPELRARVMAIAERTGVEVDRVLIADASRRTTRLNAYVSGIGASRRVVLYDTLLDAAPPGEVDLVVAHELAHEAHNDVVKGTIIGAAGAALAVLGAWVLLSQGALLARLGIAGPGDPRAIPLLLLALSVATLVTAPVQNGFSRRVEAAADRRAVAVTQDVESHISTEVRLATENIAHLSPSPPTVWFFFTHPPVLERIRIGLEWRAAHPGAEPVETGS